MDTSDPDINFDQNGICNHCKGYDLLYNSKFFPFQRQSQKLKEIVDKIKKDGKAKKYDCVIGVSGGIDSTYVAYLVKNLGLRPIAVHLDNGWDSELALSNIENTLERLGIELDTYIINWEEFKDLQLSFLKASTPDAEIPTDHAIVSLLYRSAIKYNIKYIILGLNIASEAILPWRWSSGHGDWKYIYSIHKKFGKLKLRTFPHYNLLNKFFYKSIKRLTIINILDYINYNRKDAIKLLEDELSWRDYGDKHCESIYTRFFQSYILPKKFGFDKRRAHLSSLICSGQLDREEALQEIALKPYSSEKEENYDKEYVLKKLGLIQEEFEKIMKLTHKRFNDYPSYTNSALYKFLRFLKRKFIKTSLGPS